jgi:menaquinone-dependent protoporphyrinogen oxidase
MINRMGRGRAVRVLVVYGSSRGGTADLARMVAEQLVNHGVDTDLGEATTVDELERYDAVIVGGALYSSRWHEDATWFVERNLDALRTKNVWFFSSGPLDHSARTGALAPIAHVQELARRTDIRGHMTFGGVLEERSSRFLSALLSWGKPGDYRDPQHVREWVEQIAPKLGEPKTITLPDVDDESASVATRVFRRLAAAGDDVEDASDDLGLDVFAE